MIAPLMNPFGETLLAWRLARGLTQAELARLARVARPNLSAMERGDREVTLRTLRALALALGIRPGVLADGEPPAGDARPLTRARLERVAAAAAADEPLSDAREGALARNLNRTMAASLAPDVPRARPPVSRAGDRAYLQLRMAEPPEVVASLIDRVNGRRRRA